MRESVECTRAAIDGTPLALTADLPAELILPGDRRRLRQIVDNLLGNAVKYSPDGGRITVTLKPVGRAAELAVSDTGIGVTRRSGRSCSPGCTAAAWSATGRSRAPGWGWR